MYGSGPRRRDESPFKKRSGSGFWRQDVYRPRDDADTGHEITPAGPPSRIRLRPQARDPNPHLHPSRTMPAPASSKSTESSSTPSGARAVASGSCGVPRRSLRGYVAGGSTDPCDVPISYQRPAPFRGKSLSSQQRSTIGSTIMSGIYGRRPAERICRPNRLIVIRQILSDSCLG